MEGRERARWRGERERAWRGERGRDGGEREGEMEGGEGESMEGGEGERWRGERERWMEREGEMEGRERKVTAVPIENISPALPPGPYGVVICSGAQELFSLVKCRSTAIFVYGQLT